MMTKQRQAATTLVILATIIACPAWALRRPGGPHQSQPWTPPAPTETLQAHDRAHLQFSPRPTDSPIANKDVADLRRRASSFSSIGSNTCGFFTDDGQALYCDPAYTCTNLGHFRGCCVGSECLTSSLPSVCLGATEKACSNPGEGTMCCTDDINYPYCVTYLWATTATPNLVFSLFNCDSKDFAGQQILSAAPFAVTTTGTGSTSSATSTPTVPANDNGNGTSNNNNSGSGTPVGAIVGGVIGGLAVVGIVILGVVFMVLRYRKAQALKLRKGGGDGENGSGDEASPLSGGVPGSPPQDRHQPGGVFPSMAGKMEDYGTPLTDTSQHSTPIVGYIASNEGQYATIPLYPEDKLAVSNGAIDTKRLSELGDERRAELPMEGKRLSELGVDRRAELPT